MPDIMK